MVLLDLLGRRWSLRILWELTSSSYNFRALRAACGDISPSMLNTRLRELRAASLVALNEDGYALTERGLRAHGRSGLNVWVPVPDEGAAVRRLADAGWAPAARAH